MNWLEWSWSGPFGVALPVVVIVLGVSAVLFGVFWRRAGYGWYLFAIALCGYLGFLARDPSIVQVTSVPSRMKAALILDTSASVWQTSDDVLASLHDTVQSLQASALLQDPALAIDWYLSGDTLAGPMAAEDLRTALQNLAEAGRLPSHRSLSPWVQADALAGYDLQLAVGDGVWQMEQGGHEATRPTDLLLVAPPGWQKPVYDVGIQRVSTEAFGLVRHHANIRVLLDTRVPSTTKLQLALEAADGSRFVTHTTVYAGQTTAEARFDLLVTRLGTQSWHLRLDALPSWDAWPLNNEALFDIEGYREKIRVLLISGAPGIDTRSVRQYLKGDPAVELMHFSILRTRDDNPRAPNRELSLIPFPYDDLFTRMLPQFDVVVLQNFNFFPYFRNRYKTYFDNVAKAARANGTGLIVTGGPLSFGEGMYGTTALRDVLGLRIGGRDFRQLAVPVTAVAHSATGTWPGWGHQRVVSRYNAVDPAVAGIVAYSTAGGDPLVTYNRYGQGHGVAILSPELLVPATAANTKQVRDWFASTLRWAAGDMDHRAYGLQIDSRWNVQDVALRWQAEIRDEAPLEVQLDGGAGTKVIQALALAFDGHAVTHTVSLRGATRLLALDGTQTTVPVEERPVRFARWIDPLAAERLHLWDNNVEPVAWQDFQDWTRRDLAQQGVKALESERREYIRLAGHWYGWLPVALLLAAAWWLGRRRTRPLF